MRCFVICTALVVAFTFTGVGPVMAQQPPTPDAAKAAVPETTDTPPEIKALQGSWIGEIRFPGGSVATRTLVIKEDGSLESHGTQGAMFTGRITLVAGKLRYESSIGQGRIEVAEEGRYQWLTVLPESGPSLSKAEYRRDKPKK